MFGTQIPILFRDSKTKLPVENYTPIPLSHFFNVIAPATIMTGISYHILQYTREHIVELNLNDELSSVRNLNRLIIKYACYEGVGVGFCI